MKPGAGISWAVALGFLAGVALLFGDLIVGGEGRIASHAQGDAVRYFFYLRSFGFEELRAGNLPLWNPHVFAGTPFMGGFQASMLYPPSWVHLAVPVAVGINLELAISLWVLSLGAFFWARGQGLSLSASILCAGMVGFGATASLRVLAGALTVLASYAWVPWLMCCIDALARRVTLGWLWVTAGAASMMLLAGHPPTAFMGFFVLALYGVPVFFRAEQKWRLVSGLAGAGLVALAIAGLQLALGYDVAVEGIRGAGVGLDFATTWSFPPENLLTLAVSSLFGDATATRVDYFGRWWYWDDLAFVGVTGTALALTGALASRHPARTRALWLAGVLVLLAFGRYTPVYGLAFEGLPGFDLFRAPSKFMFFVTLFVALLAGMGLDRLLPASASEEAPPPATAGWSLPARLAMGCALAGAGLLAVGAWSLSDAVAADPGRSPMALLGALNDRADWSPRSVRLWSQIAGPGLLGAGAMAWVVALVAAVSTRVRALTLLLLVLAVGELFWFAFQHRGGIWADQGVRLRAGYEEFIERAGEQRLMEVGVAGNAQMVLGGYGVWGYDPVVLDRYAQFVARSQGRRPEDLDNVGGRPPDRPSPLLRLVRLGALIDHDPARRRVAAAWRDDALGRFVFVSDYVVVEDGAQAILDRLEAPGFDPEQLAVLESAPGVAPSGEPPRPHLEVVSESTDHLELRVALESPALLVWTDSYSEGWRAQALPGSVQPEYALQPANLVLRSVALEAGRHHLRFVYEPPHFRLGQWLSGLGLAIYGSAAGLWLFGRLRKPR